MLVLKDLSSELQVLYIIQWKIEILIQCLLFYRLLLIDIFNFPTPGYVHSVTLTQMSKCSHAHQVTQDLRMRLFISLWDDEILIIWMYNNNQSSDMLKT